MLTKIYIVSHAICSFSYRTSHIIRKTAIFLLCFFPLIPLMLLIFVPIDPVALTLPFEKLSAFFQTIFLYSTMRDNVGTGEAQFCSCLILTEVKPLLAN